MVHAAAGQVEGWFDTRMFDKTGDEKQAQGWTAFVLDTNGNGKRDAYVEPDQPLDPTKDKRINSGVLRRCARAERQRDLGIDAWYAGRGRAADAWIESADHGAD